jgi:5-methylcytosine-specific restriction endonuclease McrA
LRGSVRKCNQFKCVYALAVVEQDDHVNPLVEGVVTTAGSSGATSALIL